jgi:hypothetical protein
MAFYFGLSFSNFLGNLFFATVTAIIERTMTSGRIMAEGNSGIT